MAPTARLPPKKDVALALLEQASMYIHLDPRSEAVKVPAWFKKQPQLVLQVGLNMAVQIPDLHVDEQGLSCTLSFNRSPFFCMIPWPAVFALVGENGQAMVWAEDVPAEVAAQAQAQKAPEKPRAHLRSVGDGEAPPPAPEKPVAVAKDAKDAKAPKRGPAAEPRAKRAPAASAKPKAEPKASRPTAKKAPKVAADAKPSAKRPAVAEPARAALPAQKAVQPKPAASGPATTDSGKPKRELPPYLRVVK
jgi:stringent starvation protein B